MMARTPISNLNEVENIREVRLTADQDGAEGRRMSVAVIICAYTERRLDLLVEGVEAVVAQTRQPERVVVVVDHNETLLGQIHDRFGAEIEVVPNTSARGLSGARNTGIALVEEDVVAFLDDDAVPEPDWLYELISRYDSDILGVGGSIEPRWASSRPGWFPPEFDWVVGCTYLGMPEDSGRVRNLIGANMSIRRSVFERVGGFRDELARVGTVPFGCEETELCIRAQHANPDGRFWYQPSARVRHWVSEDRTLFSYFRRQCFNEGRGKALMASLVGAEDGLSAERSYTFRILPMGVIRGLISGVRERDPAGFQRAGAIVAGLISAGFGYVLATARQRLP